MYVRRSHKLKSPPVLKYFDSLFLKAMHTGIEKCMVQQKLACCMGKKAALLEVQLKFTPA